MGQNFLYISYSRVKSMIEVIGTGIRELIMIRIQPVIKNGSRSSRKEKPDLGPTLLNNLDPVLIQFTLNFCNFKSLYIWHKLFREMLNWMSRLDTIFKNKIRIPTLTPVRIRSPVNFPNPPPHIFPSLSFSKMGSSFEIPRK